LLQREIGDALILPGRRRRDAVSFIGLLAMLPQTVLWALDERHSTQLLSIFMATMFWIAAGAGTLGAVICLIRLLRSDNVLRIDATGIACPQLWGAVIPWSRIAGIRTDGTREDTALTITFNRPMDLELQKRSRLTWSAKLDAEKRTLTIPGALLSVPADDLAVLLQDRLRHQGQEPQ
jgi:hypothetical protein